MELKRPAKRPLYASEGTAEHDSGDSPKATTVWLSWTRTRLQRIMAVSENATLTGALESKTSPRALSCVAMALHVARLLADVARAG